MMEPMPAFAKLAGLEQKFHVETGEADTYSGIYCWESKEAVGAFLKMPLKESIARAYQTENEPRIEIMSVVAILRPEQP